ncbi:hypothetical protein BDV95DRAFT_602032 [Massariosphaeria phaeospora]|uniref:SMP-30/Gluconolactonase/LRE-like region domain-containing protein n=1 Tax=Massariosphaeria phaeospora TaxID=100035 RepID=A0A7C8MXW1_9PLEO|nr:hypothetical protein BDV95DRAFT_602032 [Massariosphaeria phaeospora]
MHLSSPLASAAVLAGAAFAHPAVPQPQSKCAPFKGNFTINQYQLYPENADFDFNSCKLYLGQLWNASLGIYDPYTQEHEIVEFEGISHNPAFHLGAVGVNRKNGLVSLIADTANAFATEGRDIAGTNWLLQYDPQEKQLIHKINLTATSQGRYGGFQDVEQDPDGNVFVVGTWPGTLLKVTRDGKTVTPWYLPASINQTQKGIGGIAALDWLLLAQGDASSQLWRFDMRAPTGIPTPIPVTNANHTFGASDAIYLPPKYAGTVLLVAEDTVGLSVFYSRDAKWRTAEFRGVVPIGEVDAGTSVVTAAQVGDGIYMVLEPFGDEGLGGPGTAGGRGVWPFRDVGGEVEALLR